MTERGRQKIVLHRQLPYLRMQLLPLVRTVRRLDRMHPKHILRLLHQPFLPVLDLIRMHIELLGSVRQRALATHRG